MRHARITAWIALSAAALGGCGSSLDCLTGDNVRGRVLMTSTTSGTEPRGGAKLLIQYSEDSFTSIKRTATSDNKQGFTSVPFSLCADLDRNFQLRAFQDINGDRVWATGEAAGRDDGTANGNATYTSAQVSKTAAGLSSSREGVEIVLDETTAQ